MTKAADLRVHRSSTTSFVAGLVKRFKRITVKMLQELVCEVPAECGRKVSDTELRLMFVKSEYIIPGCIPTIQNFDLEKHSSQSRSNMKEELEEYLHRTGSCLLAIIETVRARFCR